MTFAGAVCNKNIDSTFIMLMFHTSLKERQVIHLMCLNSMTLLCNHVNKVNMQLCWLTDLLCLHHVLTGYQIYCCCLLATNSKTINWQGAYSPTASHGRTVVEHMSFMLQPCQWLVNYTFTWKLCHGHQKFCLLICVCSFLTTAAMTPGVAAQVSADHASSSRCWLNRRWIEHSLSARPPDGATRSTCRLVIRFRLRWSHRVNIASFSSTKVIHRS